jgi:hypothetical protein
MGGSQLLINVNGNDEGKHNSDHLREHSVSQRPLAWVSGLGQRSCTRAIWLLPENGEPSWKHTARHTTQGCARVGRRLLAGTFMLELGGGRTSINPAPIPESSHPPAKTLPRSIAFCWRQNLQPPVMATAIAEHMHIAEIGLPSAWNPKVGLGFGECCRRKS